MTIRKILGSITNKGIKRVSGRVDTGTAGYDSIVTGPGPATLMAFTTTGPKTLANYGSSTWTPSNQSRQIKSVINPTAALLPSPGVVELLVIAGGGGDSSPRGGGAGGVIYYGSTPSPIRVAPTYTLPSANEIAVYVGSGGGGSNAPGVPRPPYNGQPGEPSVFGSLTAIGGGAGGFPGGSGGGGSFDQPGVPYPTLDLSGAPGTPGQGTPGGVAIRNPAPTFGGGGGGGATGSGGTPNPNSGPGGQGIQLPIFNPFGVPAPPGNNWFAGGGGGSSTPANFGAPQQGAPGFGGGGYCTFTGGPNAAFPGTPGATNTGAGGGAAKGGQSSTGGFGGSGIIIIRY
jgi:hypothetical protein